MRRSFLLLSSSLIVLIPTAAHAFDLGAAQDFNAFVFGALSYSNTDFQGRVAVGGSASLSSIGIGFSSGIPGSTTLTADPNRNDLIVGGDLTFTNGQLYKGSGQVGGTRTTTNVTLLTPGAAWNTGTSINFATAQSSLNALSTAYGAMATNGTQQIQFGGVTLTAAGSGTSVFDLTTSDLSSANSFTINGNASSQILINVFGGIATAQNFGFTLNGVTANNVLFNFVNAGSLSISSVGIQGSILAPTASVSFVNGNINGTMVAANLTGNGEFHNFPSAAPVPEPATLTALALGGLALVRRRRAAQR